MYVSEHAVTPAFRARIAHLLPGLGDNLVYWRFAGFLMFSGGLRAHELLIPQALIAKIEGKKTGGDYSAWKFLAAFQRDVGVKIEMNAHTTQLCRTVTRVHWPGDVEALLHAERRVTGGQRVLFATGSRWRREHAARNRQEAQDEALELMRDMGNHPACDLLALLNNAAPNRFSNIKRHLEDAHALVDTLDLIPDETERQHNILEAIEQQAQPFYKSAAKTVRIFAMNDCVARLQRDVRHTLTRDWITCDLKSAQLAICAKTWNVPGVAEFLRAGGSIWHSLSAWLDLEAEQKPMLKDALYALVFGAGRDKMIAILESRRLYERFRAHPLIHQMFLARARQLRAIRTAQGAHDAFGRWIAIAYMPVPEKRYSHDTSRKILALVAQSYELLLLTPVIQLAMEQRDSSHGFVITLWLHDGFSFDTCHPGDRLSWAKRLQHAVEGQIATLGIATELEITFLDSRHHLSEGGLGDTLYDLSEGIEDE